MGVCEFLLGSRVQSLSGLADLASTLQQIENVDINELHYVRVPLSRV
jgi:hypothetical protein